MGNNPIKFKTNLNCGGCIAKVQADLDANLGTGNWSVDTSVPEKILTISKEVIDEDLVVTTVEAKGFRIEKLN